MSTDVYNLKWKHFYSNQSSCLIDLFTKNNNTDVTLVTDDKAAFQAHQFVLSACSSVFKDLLLNNPHPYPMIYLNGVKKCELDSLLQFIYLGKTQFDHSRMEKFLKNGRDLGIKQLSQPLVSNDEILTKETFICDEMEDAEDKSENLMRVNFDEKRVHLSEKTSNQRLTKEQTIITAYMCDKCEAPGFNSMQELSLHSKNIHESRRFNCQIKTSDMSNLKHEGVRYSCDICTYKARRKGDLKWHKESNHKGVRYTCDRCDYMVSQLGTLKRHKESIHKGIRYSCDICNYKASRKDNLKLHNDSIHEDIKYSCDFCEYKASQKSSLKKHKESIHKGFRYPCDICNHKATTTRDLKRHKKSIHEGVRYSCDICDFKASQLGNLKLHKGSIHEGVKYYCHSCEYFATQKGSLTRHIKEKHAGEISK